MAERDVLDAAVETLKAPVALGDRAIAATLAELGHDARRAWWRRLGWGAAMAAGLLLALGRWLPQRSPAARQEVRFALAAPAAARVTLIGDFNDWDPGANPLRQRRGEWSVTLRLEPGRYRYAFVLDDSRWLADPGTPAAEDDFGTPTSAITVTN